MYTIKDKQGVVIFEGRSLAGANLRWADLTGVDLRGADLMEADLEGADLEGADLEGADLRWTTGNGREVKSLTTPKYKIVIAGDIVHIGCEVHTLEQWLDFTDDQIDRMDVGALEWWKEHKDQVVELATRDST